MQGENHALMFEFPEYKDKIHEMKMSNKGFGSLVDEYHHLDHKIRGLEMANIPTDDENFRDLRMRRVQLKDEIYQQITQ
ncbi:hypothetical protein A1OO_16035 [Enterovibrio norvegicus FF-33]|uniref:GTP-binding protein n=2 Tax=Enterovibrio TaxID=188143 RepID=A0A1E5BW86_9GAMM|nr:DUF465 domain-containing protein [Enterovibrio norvegicus]OEE57470.1 hypothetical protein A1OK_17760 [Enterovibrio norvegicus FF-454]OEE67261.1 hypothetical protein A1OO_16035 [Enterovibrio norvegicus FF-33]OEE85069.1 hypothetical protein A1OQ_18295 [Enterovibrio norvegicus FF-162]